MVWSMLNDMSSLTLLSLLALNVPGAVQPLSKLILGFVYMDLLMTDRWFTPMLDLDEENQEALSPYFENLGFSSMTAIVNLGSTFLFLGAVLTLGVL